MNKNIIKHASKIPTPCYIVDMDGLERNFKRLQACMSKYFEKFEIGYSYKTNYVPNVCQTLNDLGAVSEVVSGMELDLALAIGVVGKNVIFNGPLKTKEDLKLAFENSVLVNIDSYEEFNLIKEIARDWTGPKIRLGIRCNISIPGKNTSRFGIEINSPNFELCVQGIIKITGYLECLHVHVPYRDLNSWAARCDAINKILKKLNPCIPLKIDFGGGLFGSIPEKLIAQLGGESPTFEDYAKLIWDKIDKKYFDSKTQCIVLEPGTALVSDAVYFIVTVINIKNINDETFITVDGSSQNMFGTGSKLDLPLKILKCKKTNRRSSLIRGKIVGYTCIENDVLHSCFSSDIEIGDKIIFTHCGSYSIVMKPPFIQTAPEIYGLTNDNLYILRKKETSRQLYFNYSMLNQCKN